MNSVEVLRRSLESGDFGRCEADLEALARIERLVAAANVERVKRILRGMGETQTDIALAAVLGEEG